MYFFKFNNGVTVPARETIKSSIDQARNDLKSAAYIMKHSDKNFNILSLEIITGQTPGIEAKKIRKVTTVTVNRELRTTANLEELEKFLISEEFRPIAVNIYINHQNELNQE